MFRTTAITILLASCAGAFDLSRDSAPARSLKTDSVTRAALEETYGQLLVTFEPNRGQVDKRVKWRARCRGYTLFLTEHEAVMALREGGGKPSGVVRMRLAGSRPWRTSEGLEPVGGVSNYFIGSDSKSWRTGIPRYRRVKIDGVYAGIDLVFYGNPEKLEYDLVVEPGADPEQIRFAYEGLKRIGVDGVGNLMLTTHAGAELRLQRPRVYQEIGGRQVKVAARYEVQKRGQVRIRLESYDSGEPLVIDPVLVYSTYLGGAGMDKVQAISTGPEGDVYVTGTTWSVDFPTTPGSPPLGRDGQQAFVTRLNSTGTALIYSTFLGGDWSDGDDIFVDSTGQAYIVGSAGRNFPVTPGAYQNSPGVFGRAGFVAKLNPTGTALLYSTYFRSDGIQALAVDSDGNAYIAGTASPPDFVTTPGAFQTEFGGGDWDAFAAKLNSAGTGVIYATYLGGSGDDAASDIAVDSDGSSYITGGTQSATFPITSQAFQKSYRGSNDVFVTKLNVSGAALLYSTYLGGSGLESGDGTNPSEPSIALDAAGNAYIAGSTRSTDFPVSPSAYQRSAGAWGDVFVTKLDPAGTALVYSTYLGGSATDSAASLAVDPQGNAYVVGAASEFPTTPGAIRGCPQTYEVQNGSLTNPCDTYLTKISPAGSSLVYSTGLGASMRDIPARALALDRTGNPYVTGATGVKDFPVTAGAVQGFNKGQSDGMVVKFDLSTVVSTVSAASFIAGGALAPESIGSGFGQDLAAVTEAATTLPLPTTLANVSVAVRDSAGWERPAPLFFVSGGQINYLVPAGTKPGIATVVITNQNRVILTGSFLVEAVAPSLFSANASGKGVAAAIAVRYAADNSQSWDYVFQCGSTPGSCIPKPIDLGSATDRVYLQLYGTGIRGASSLSAVVARVGGEKVTVEYTGPQGGFVGLDQVNVSLPRGLAGRGEVDLVLTVDGKTANTVTISIK